MHADSATCSGRASSSRSSSRRRGANRSASRRTPVLVPPAAGSGTPGTRTLPRRGLLPDSARGRRARSPEPRPSGRRSAASSPACAPGRALGGRTAGVEIGALDLPRLAKGACQHVAGRCRHGVPTAQGDEPEGLAVRAGRRPGGVPEDLRQVRLRDRVSGVAADGARRRQPLEQRDVRPRHHA